MGRDGGLWDPHLRSYVGTVETACAAKRNQRIVTRIETAFGGHLADRLNHVCIRNRDDTIRSTDYVHAKLVGKGLDNVFRKLAIQLYVSARQRFGIQRTE